MKVARDVSCRKKMVKYSRAEVLYFILFPLVLEFKDVSFEIGSYSFTTKLLFSHIILRDPTEKKRLEIQILNIVYLLKRPKG